MNEQIIIIFQTIRSDEWNAISYYWKRNNVYIIIYTIISYIIITRSIHIPYTNSYGLVYTTVIYYYIRTHTHITINILYTNCVRISIQYYKVSATGPFVLVVGTRCRRDVREEIGETAKIKRRRVKIYSARINNKRFKTEKRRKDEKNRTFCMAWLLTRYNCDICIM